MFVKSGQQNLFSFGHVHEKPPGLIKQKTTGLLYIHVHAYIWSCVFKLHGVRLKWKNRSPFEGCSFLSRPENDLSWISGPKKQTGNLVMLQEKHTRSKVAACYSCNVSIRNNILELLDIACNFIKSGSGTGLSSGFLRTGF